VEPPARFVREGAGLIPALSWLQGRAGVRSEGRNVVRYPISVRTLEPDVSAPWTIEDDAGDLDLELRRRDGRQRRFECRLRLGHPPSIWHDTHL
jgi:hypothetical protein